MYVVSIISGKGGSGKTSVALALAQILTILNRKVLLVDVDSGTHGASYFFDAKFPGLEEWVLARHEYAEADKSLQKESKTSEFDFDDCIRPTNTEPSFQFLPSKTVFKETEWDVDHVADYADEVDVELRDIIETNRFDYVIMDCQAGVNQMTAKALRLSTHAIIVTELDAISTKALKNLEFQFRHILPERTRAVINKLFLKEHASYDQVTFVFRGLDFLPPIPFDFEIRDAFARNEIPLRQGKPSAYFSAMLRIIRDSFSELVSETENMAKTLQRVEFEDYEVELERVEIKMAKLEDEKSELISRTEQERERIEHFRRMLVPMSIMLISALPAGFYYLSQELSLKPSGMTFALLISGIGFLASYGWFVWDMLITRRSRKLQRGDRRREDIDAELKTLVAKKEKYSTLYLTERRKTLL